ncbi:hypothetical protein ASE48_02630 [Mycobacterium sp. Root265]|uniref:hypothetical protein n=1 Tax=Mycobacterium sp. Root265 TaxID=1736504 RepID=UPI00070D71EA|nr:hypothetical protein [Mycobacterium sp. Root265]KRD20698.1 hypothetical protein ASE48_02630 [Mycobacterium sp. Root265]
MVVRENHLARVQLHMVDWVRQTSELPALSGRLARRDEQVAPLPALDAADEDLVRRLDETGVASRRVDMDGAAHDEIATAVRWLSTHDTTRSVSYLPNAPESLYRWGLDEQNLDIAERHIQRPVRYVGLEVKVERAREPHPSQQARHWHLDAEDRRMLKIIVYLNDVDSGCGPFQHLSLPTSEDTRRRLRCRPGITFLDDEAIAGVAPRSDWHHVTGTAGTAVYADTGRLVHRLMRPTDRDRYSVTFVYTSDRPYVLYSRFMPPRSFVEAMAAESTPRQRRALPEPSWQRNRKVKSASTPSSRQASNRSAS